MAAPTGKGIAARLGDDPVADALIEASRDDGLEEGPGVLVVQAAEQELRQADEVAVVIRLPHREHERHVLREQPPGHETQDLARGAVKPVGVIDEAEDGLLLGDLGEQGQGPERHQETVRRIPGHEAQRDAQCALLGLRKAAELPKHRCAELMESRKRQLHLGFHSSDLGDSKTGALLGDRSQERRLSNPRFAADDEHRAPAAARVLHQSLERFALAEPAAKAPHGLCGHLDCQP